MTTLAFAIEKTSNQKTGPVSVTYASQASCPKSCPLLHNGCYAEAGPMGIHTRRIASTEATPKEVAEQEAKAIKELKRAVPLRLHVVGDCPTEEAAEIVSKASDDYRKRFKQPVWSYTHAWREVKRKFWRSVSVLASCETVAALRQAMKRRYATALIATDQQLEKYKAENTDLRFIKCPQQTGK